MQELKGKISIAVGPQGPRGLQGPQGRQGIQGPKGDKGETGEQGPIGLTGPQGIQGIQGPIGPQGKIGPQGIQGPKGDKGKDGTVKFEELTEEQKAELKGGTGSAVYHLSSIDDNHIDKINKCDYPYDLHFWQRFVQDHGRKIPLVYFIEEYNGKDNRFKSDVGDNIVIFAITSEGIEVCINAKVKEKTEEYVYLESYGLQIVSVAENSKQALLEGVPASAKFVQNNMILTSNFYKYFKEELETDETTGFYLRKHFYSFKKYNLPHNKGSFDVGNKEKLDEAIEDGYYMTYGKSDDPNFPTNEYVNDSMLIVYSNKDEFLKASKVFQLFVLPTGKVWIRIKSYSTWRKWHEISGLKEKEVIDLIKKHGGSGGTGTQGPKGDKGDIGPQGPKGDRGEKGPKGDIGPQGPPGPAGSGGIGGSGYLPNITITDINKALPGINITLPDPENQPYYNKEMNTVYLVEHHDTISNVYQEATIIGSDNKIAIGSKYSRLKDEGIWQNWKSVITNESNITNNFLISSGNNKYISDADKISYEGLFKINSPGNVTNIPKKEKGILINLGNRSSISIQYFYPYDESYGKIYSRQSNNKSWTEWKELGLQGPAGKDGKDGAQGPTGPKGDVGPKGPKGEDGKDYIGLKETLGISTNFDTIKTSGLYEVIQNHSELPSSSFPKEAHPYGILEVLKTGNSTTQRYTANKSGQTQIFVRNVFQASGWSAWKEVSGTNARIKKLEEQVTKLSLALEQMASTLGLELPDENPTVGTLEETEHNSFEDILNQYIPDTKEEILKDKFDIKGGK